jgi:hypothetical protein
MQLSGWANALTQVTTFGCDPLSDLTNVIDPRGYGWDGNVGVIGSDL